MKLTLKFENDKTNIDVSVEEEVVAITTKGLDVTESISLTSEVQQMIRGFGEAFAFKLPKTTESTEATTETEKTPAVVDEVNPTINDKLIAFMNKVIDGDQDMFKLSDNLQQAVYRAPHSQYHFEITPPARDNFKLSTNPSLYIKLGIVDDRTIYGVADNEDSHELFTSYLKRNPRY